MFYFRQGIHNYAQRNKPQNPLYFTQYKHSQAVVSCPLLLPTSKPHFCPQNPRGTAELRLGEPKSAHSESCYFVGDLVRAGRSSISLSKRDICGLLSHLGQGIAGRHVGLLLICVGTCLGRLAFRAFLGPLEKFP